MIFNIDKETLPREDIEALQLRRLQDLCSRVYANVPFYRKRFDESGIKPGDIKSLADLKNLPFTEKQDLRNYYPFGLFAVPRDNIVRLHASSGTTGKPTVVGYTREDLDMWSRCNARLAVAAGAVAGQAGKEIDDICRADAVFRARGVERCRPDAEAQRQRCAGIRRAHGALRCARAGAEQQRRRDQGAQKGSLHAGHLLSGASKR